MKNPKKLTYNERRIIQSWGVKGDYWYRVKHTPDTLTIYNSLDGNIKEVPNRERVKRYGVH